MPRPEAALTLTRLRRGDKVTVSAIFDSYYSGLGAEYVRVTARGFGTIDGAHESDLTLVERAAPKVGDIVDYSVAVALPFGSRVAYHHPGASTHGARRVVCGERLVAPHGEFIHPNFGGGAQYEITHLPD